MLPGVAYLCCDVLEGPIVGELNMYYRVQLLVLFVLVHVCVVGWVYANVGQSALVQSIRL